MKQRNNLYNYFSHLILKYFINGVINSGSKYQIKFENVEDVSGLYNYLEISAEIFGLERGKYQYYDFETYYVTIKGMRLIVAAHDNEDLLTGLRNNFQKIDGFEHNTAILFIHCSELESINKGAESLNAKQMPLHYDTVSTNIIKEFQEEECFSPTQKEFLKQLIKAEASDYQIENSNVFDLKKYLVILIDKKLTRESYNDLGVFFDEKIQFENIPAKEVKRNLDQNIKWFSEITINEEHGALEGYLKRHFDKDGQAALSNKENWKNVTFQDIQKFVTNRDKISFNDYLPNLKNLNSEGFTVWDREEGKSPTKAKTRNIIIFNQVQTAQVSLSLKFKRRPNIGNFSSKYQGKVNEDANSIDIIFDLTNSEGFFSTEMHYKEIKEEKLNVHRFKVLIVPFGEVQIRPIRSSYIVQSPKKDQIGLEIYADDAIVFNEEGEDVVYEIAEPYQSYELNDHTNLTLKLGDKDEIEGLSLPFKIRYGKASLFCKFLISDTKPGPISGLGVWIEKNASQKSFYFTHKKDLKLGRSIVTLEHDTSIYSTLGEHRKDLLLEEMLIDAGFLISDWNDSELISGDESNIAPELIESYRKVIAYFRGSIHGSYRILPSTAYLDDDLVQLYQEFIDSYFTELEKIQNNDSLSPALKALLRIGTISEIGHLKRLKLSPLHPVNLAYQLKLKGQLDETFIQENNKELFKKLSPINLLPFINKGSGKKDFYISLDQDHSPEWLYYVSADIEGQSINRRNAAEMISEKIKEFVRHFSYLYMDSDAPIRLNLINIGNGKEALQGIFQYFSEATKELTQKSRNPNEVFPIRLNIYGSGHFVTYFEQFSKFDDPVMIEKEFDINLFSLKGKMEVEDFLRLYHQKVQFFIKADSESVSHEYEYAHISFHQFNEDQIEKSDNNTLEVSTGISLGGILSDLPSIYIHGNYRTGFGIGNMTLSEDRDILGLVGKLNGLSLIDGTSNIYRDHFAFATVINNSVKSGLSKVYDASQWVTFINPRVDLSFFKNNKDVVIIHYTDQYSNSSSYDSITITTKWEQYEFIIKEYLSAKIDHVDPSIKSIINLFNALNGYWLLKLGSQNQTEQVNKEKISILSAVKEALALLDHPKITWVALSLEEIVRVTGSSGLKQNQGLFSVKNLKMSGNFSDDLLMIGIEEVEGQLQLYFYPIEVKLGNNSSETLDKGKKQSESTYKLLIETLSQKGFNGKIYRNYFAKLILNAAQKLSLYEVWPEYSEKWNKLEQSRGKLLNDDFVFGTLSEHIGKYAVISFRKNESFGKREIKIDGDQMNIGLFESDGLNDLVLPIEKLKERYSIDSALGINTDSLLANKYLTSKISVVLINEDNFEDEKVTKKETNQDDEISIISDGPYPIEEPDYGDEPNGDPKSMEEKGIDFSDEEEKVQAENTSPLKVLFGNRTSNGQPLEWFPTTPEKVMHTNTGIIGTMGTGKTQFTKSLITQLIRNTGDNVGGKKIGILIFDYKGDYIKEDFVKATGARVYDLHQLPFNPFGLSLGEKMKKLLPLHTASTFQETITKAFNLGNKQTLALTDIIMDAYANVGIYKNDPTSWSRPAPTLKDVFELYIENEKVSKDSLYAALVKLYNFEIFEPVAIKTKPLFDLIDGVTIINLNENSPEIQNLIVAITLDQFYSQMQTSGHSKMGGNFRQINKMILVDEADNFLSKNFESLKKILKEGREYGVGTILSTQFMNHFATGDNEYSQYIFTWIIHRVSEIKDREIYSVFDLPNKKDREELIGEIKALPIHHSIVNLSESQPIKIRDKAFWELDL